MVQLIAYGFWMYQVLRWRQKEQNGLGKFCLRNTTLIHFLLKINGCRISSNVALHGILFWSLVDSFWMFYLSTWAKEVLPTITRSVKLGKDTNRFWYREIDASIKYHLRQETQGFDKQGYGCVGAIFGGEYGHQRFCCPLHLIFRKSFSKSTSALSIIIKWYSHSNGCIAMLNRNRKYSQCRWNLSPSWNASKLKRPIENFISRILHIIIGMDYISFLEWVKESRKSWSEELEVQNTNIFAAIQLQQESTSAASKR